MKLSDYEISAKSKRPFRGLNTFLKDKKSFRPGVASDSLNWITSKFGDHIELRRGSALLGQTRQTGVGKVTGIGVGIRYDGVEVPYYSHGQKVKYYDADDDDTHETGTDILGSAADGEDVWFAPYQNLAGSMMYFGSPNSGTFKSPLANPANAVNQATGSFRFGTLRIANGRSKGGQRNGTTAGSKDLTGLYLSAIDKALLSSFTQTTGEAYGTGDGTTKTFAHTLAAQVGVLTSMYISVTDGVETFTDDRNGVMIGSLGGTGTVNYATGEVSVTFNTAPLNAVSITCSYYTEDSTSGGVLDFNTAVLGAGKAKTYRQDDAGQFMNVLPFQNVDYSVHLLKTWAVTIALDDTESTNLPYRNIGVSYPRSVFETPDGILLIDTSNPSEPKVRRIQVGQAINAPVGGTLTQSIEPAPISDALDLSGYSFARAVAYRFGDLEIVCLAEYVNGVPNEHNSLMYVRNVNSGSWDRLDYRASCLATYNGGLIAGDAISNNVFALFSGYDDDESPIENYWQDGQLNLGTDNLKRTHNMRVTGLIQRDQSIKVSLSLDGGNPVQVFIIEGDGSYVDQGISTTIGSRTIGSKVIGDGGSDTAHPFDVTFPVHTDKYQSISVRFEALAIGYAAINSYEYKDNRDKGSRSLASKTV